MVLIEEEDEDHELQMPLNLAEAGESEKSSQAGSGGAAPAEEGENDLEGTVQPEPRNEDLSHSDELRLAIDYLARAQRVLCTITSDVVLEGMERLHAVKRSLQEDLEVASSITVDERLQVLLKLHCQALEDCKGAEDKCEAEQPEILMLRRSIAEISRRMPKTGAGDEMTSSCEQEVAEDPSEPRSGRLAALQKALELRSRQAQVAKGSLLSEDKLLSANLTIAKSALQEAVLEGQRLEEMRDEAEAEVFRACRALASVEDQGESADAGAENNKKRTASQKAREIEAFVAKGPAAPWRLSALHQPSGTGSIGTTAALLDPEPYRLNRKKATAQADKNLEAMLEDYVAEKEQIQRSVHEEVQRQKDEESHFAAELQNLREHVQQRRHGVDTALAAQSAEKDQRLLEAQRQLTLELRQIESQERSNQEALRQEVRKARQRLAQAAAYAKQQLDFRLVKVRTECREMIRSTAMQWERAVLRERQALQEAKGRREKWQKRLKVSRDAFRGHCIKTGVYARSLDSGRRHMLDSLVPREKVRDVYSWDPKT